MGTRIFGFLFSGIFSFGVGLIGYGMTEYILRLSLFSYRVKDHIGYVWDSKATEPFPNFYIVCMVLFTVLGALLGFLLGSILYRRIVEIGKNLKRIKAEDKIACTIGTILFSFPAFILGILLFRVIQQPLILFSIIMLEWVLLVWLGNVLMLSMKEELKFLVPLAHRGANAAQEDAAPSNTIKLLDTNVIIDGRIYDICRSGFLDGPIVLPGFVLEELQHIADSPDPLRRNRGRRGLDILNNMQKELDTVLQIMDRYKVNFSPGDPVDIKLVKLAKALGSADIVTNDYNLNKVAKLHGVRVLNINELANAVKPVVLPGEEMHITIIREGKEYHQGVGYLDDGTMVVVENGKKMLGETVTVAVSSVLQTVAGKMIFAELKYETMPEGNDENSSNNAGRGVRRKTV